MKDAIIATGCLRFLLHRQKIAPTRPSVPLCGTVNCGQRPFWCSVPYQVQGARRSATVIMGPGHPLKQGSASCHDWKSNMRTLILNLLCLVLLTGGSNAADCGKAEASSLSYIGTAGWL